MMEGAIQGIFLNRLEKLEGICICTSNKKLDEDFAYLHALHSENRFWNFLDSLQGVNEADKIPERRRMFESLINRGQIGRIRNEHFTPANILECVMIF